MAISGIPSTPTPIVPIDNSSLQQKPASTVTQAGNTFGQMLDSLNQSQNQADSLVQSLASGDNVDLHSVLIGVEENDVNYRVAMAIRDRLVDAYREVMRVNI